MNAPLDRPRPDGAPYDPVVVPGGPSTVRRLPGMTIRKMSVSAMHNNVYLLTSTTSGAQILIDAADDAHRIGELVAEGTGRLDALITTHQHWDHTRALIEVTQQFGPTTYAGAEDADALPLAPDVRLGQGDRIEVDGITLDVLALRGHTPGSVALAYADPSGGTHLFTGDSLFPGGLGNTTMAGQSFEALYADVTERVFARFDDDTWFYPGHGSDSTLGAERPQLAEWRERGW